VGRGTRAAFPFLDAAALASCCVVGHVHIQTCVYLHLFISLMSTTTVPWMDACLYATEELVPDISSQSGRTPGLFSSGWAAAHGTDATAKPFFGGHGPELVVCRSLSRFPSDAVTAHLTSPQSGVSNTTTSYALQVWFKNKKTLQLRGAPPTRPPDSEQRGSTPYY
jgi:hypothetical protein